MSAAPAPRLVVARARLASQWLLPGAGARPTPAAVVGQLGLLQAQDLGQAFWALGVRSPGSTASSVRAAFDDGSIVRTWAARGTLMIVRPGLLDDLLTVTGPRMRAQTATGFRQAGISEQDVEAVAPVALQRCADGATRGQLLEAFRFAGQETSGQRGYLLLMALSVARILVQGPLEGSGSARQLFVPYRSWIGGSGNDGGDRRAALERLALCYFGGHGPATEADFAWWLGLPLTPVRATLATLLDAGSLASRRVEGIDYWMAPATAAGLDAGVPVPGARTVLALPGFDEFLLGYRDRRASLSAEHAPRVVPGGNGVFRRTIVHGGATIGIWDPDAGAEPFGTDLGPGAARAFAARMREYSDFRAR
ncbi:winged helix DNA-binding domain-containing protein [Arthrobacter rhombi]|uniref:winged helix DNA-binding domain-containing protein n=1 Tax=Arthrobacter rhombi TaxID=71253 RepID=UPI0031D9B37B